jgi:hypothetical protein
MHPIVMHDVARHEQADRLRTAKRERLAHEVSKASDVPQRRFRLLSGHRVALLRRSVFSR